jgi:hypothetical protein
MKKFQIIAGIVLLIRMISSLAGEPFAEGSDEKVLFPLILRAGECLPPTAGPTIHSGGHLNANQTWTADGSPHQINGSITVDAGLTLTLEPCAVVQLAEGVSLEVKGSLMAQGNAAKPILFTAWEANPWAFLKIAHPGTATLAYTTIEKGGSNFTYTGASLIVSGDNLKPIKKVLRVDHLTIKDSQGYGVLVNDLGAFADNSTNLVVTGSGKGSTLYNHPVYLEAPALGTLPSGQFTGNGTNAIHVDPGSMVTSEVIVREVGVPYHIRGTNNLRLNRESAGSPAPTLTLQAGVVMKFDPNTALLADNGQLLVQGTSGKPVIFDAWDTNPWKYIRVTYPATANLTYTTIQNGGSDLVTYNGASLLILGDNLRPIKKNVTVDHVTVKDSAGYGVELAYLGAFSDASANLAVTGSGKDPASNPYPVFIQAQTLGSLPLGRYTGNRADAIHVAPDQAIKTDITVRNVGVPYVIWKLADLRVGTDIPGDPPPTLKLLSGVQLMFEEGIALWVGSPGPGALQANATRFTSAKQSPAPGNWKGIIFASSPGSATNNIQSSTIEYAGGDCACGGTCDNPHGSSGAVIISGWKPDTSFISSSIISLSAANGIVRAWTGQGGADFTPSNTFFGIAGCQQTAPSYDNCPGCEP